MVPGVRASYTYPRAGGTHIGSWPGTHKKHTHTRAFHTARYAVWLHSKDPRYGTHAMHHVCFWSGVKTGCTQLRNEAKLRTANCTKMGQKALAHVPPDPAGGAGGGGWVSATIPSNTEDI